MAVIEGDLASDIDTRALRALGIEAYQIETGGDCHLNAAMIEAVLRARCGIEDGSWLFIENIGNLVCPAEFVIGEDLKIVVVGVSEGSDKPYKYPFIFTSRRPACSRKSTSSRRWASTRPSSRPGLAAAAPGAQLLPLNGRTGEGADEILDWLRRVRAAAKAGDQELGHGGTETRSKK